MVVLPLLSIACEALSYNVAKPIRSSDGKRRCVAYCKLFFNSAVIAAIRLAVDYKLPVFSVKPTFSILISSTSNMAIGSNLFDVLFSIIVKVGSDSF